MAEEIQCLERRVAGDKNEQKWSRNKENTEVDI